MSIVVDLPPDTPPSADGTKAGGWWHTSEETGRIICDLCPRECNMKPGDRGFCFVRENREGEMVLTTYGRSTGFCVDPIEKKPLSHFLPGTAVLSFGTAGCNLGCKFCQNWDISKSREVERLSELATPEAIAAAAKDMGCHSVAYTYNDPVIWAEYAIDTAKACRQLGIKNVAVTAGYITEQARGPFYEYIDAANVDLKAFTEEFYFRITQSHIDPVLKTLEWLKKETDVWFEITNLIIPDANDSPDELRQMCDWILDRIGDLVPVHFSAFHPDFRMLDRPNTPHETLLMAHEIAQRQGLKYAFVGNVHDQQRDSSFCHHCGQLIIQRDWYQLGAYYMQGNRCGHCGGEIPGVFADRPGDWGRRRLPVQISQYNQPTPNSFVPTESIKMPPAANSDSTPTSPPEAVRSLELTDEQAAAIRRAAGEVVAAIVNGRQPQLSDPSLAGAASTIVMGSFVTLKRKGQLRACCGVLAKPFHILDAVVRSAERTAGEDVRLPTISPTELRQLDLSVSLLHSFLPVPSNGRDRISDVEVGRHGLQIRRGQSSGLLLPSVATELNLTSEEFLRHVCSKAGLPTTAWASDDVELITFESHTIDGTFDADVLGPGDEVPTAVATPAELATLAQYCASNIMAHLTGATPYYVLPDCPDGMINGAALRMAIPGANQSLQVAELSMRPAVPLQATLLKLTQTLAAAIARSNVTPGAMQQGRLGLTLLTDPAMHGTVADPDLRGFDPTARAVVIRENNHVTWSFDPSKPSDELLTETGTRGQVTTPEGAAVVSFAALSTEPSESVTSVPQAQTGAAVRPAAVAGTFYPGTADELNTMVSEMLDASRTNEKREYAAAMVPHAGLVYSGRLAADVLNRITFPKTIIAIGPKHTPHGVNWSVAPHETWSIPGATIQSDPQLAQQLADAIPNLQLDAAAHQLEHGVEVELPILARLAPDTRVVAIAIGSATLDQCRQFAHGLTEVINKMDEPPLLLISSDMNHYANDDDTRRLDELALAELDRLDPEALFNSCTEHRISMCGMRPAVMILEALRELGKLNSAVRVGYATSADVSGDSNRVVGYAGMLFE
ncbi:MAG: AmmeMemoRadiSam system radical SAM enzyme [Planctomycetota bacterium]|nr:AmmeMemoRadiSam system radical SAM enzyme [Planctomycetota bacterium]